MGPFAPFEENVCAMAFMKPPKTLLIAEAGVNHNGSLAMALKLVDAAADAGADVVKFQTFTAEKLASALAPKAQYQIETTGRRESQLQMLKRLELSPVHHEKLMARCRKRGIEFLSTAFDVESLDFLTRTLHLRRIKMPSGELTNPLLLLAAARARRPLILSTGMANLKEIELALGVLAYGYLKPKEPPTRRAFKKAFAHAKASTVLKKYVTVLHCTTAYPAPLKDVNLRAMDTMAARFGLPVGYSDHTLGTAVAIAAAARGATIIEKHLTLDRELPGPDHRASLEPAEFNAMVMAIREAERALGDSRKICRASEIKNRPIARKSLVAARDIARGEQFSEDNVTAKRPARGRSVYDYWDLLGKPAKRAYRKNDLL
jgi:N-acetylneuraminate synthase